MADFHSDLIPIRGRGLLSGQARKAELAEGCFDLCHGVATTSSTNRQRGWISRGLPISRCRPDS